MRAKIVLLYETETGKKICNAASRVLAQTAVAFGHTISLPVRQCAHSEGVSDELLDFCGDADAVLACESGMSCLPELASELMCAVRVRDLRYASLIENRSLTGRDYPLNCVIVQALENETAALELAAKRAFEISAQEHLQIDQVPPSGKLAQAWQTAIGNADSLSAPYHARELALPSAVPEMIYRTSRFGVIVCPPYAGGILAEASAALSGAPGMCYDEYAGGECALYAPLRDTDDAADPFGMLRAICHLLKHTLKLEKEAGCLEAAISNVLQAGWRTSDILSPDTQLTDIEGAAELICGQIELAGSWIIEK